MISAHKLKDRVIHLQRLLSSDGAGGQDISYIETSDIPAYIAFISSSENVQVASLRQTPLTYHIVTRIGLTIKPGDQFVSHDKIFDVKIVHEHPESDQYVMSICEFTPNPNLIS